MQSPGSCSQWTCESSDTSRVRSSRSREGSRQPGASLAPLVHAPLFLSWRRLSAWQMYRLVQGMYRLVHALRARADPGLGIRPREEFLDGDNHF